MKRFEFFNMINGLFGFFRYKEAPDNSVIDAWHKELEYIDAAAIQFITKELKELENLPRNLPKAIKGSYQQYKRTNTSGNYIKYDTYDDPRYPIGKLQEATELLLTTNDEKRFLEFCHKNYMPQQDIERCRCKAKKIESLDVERLASGMLRGV